MSSSARILIVEDEEDLVATLEYNLQQEGYQTLKANTGKEGLELATKKPHPDMVLLDIMLPDLSGTEVCRILRSADTTRNLPIIIMTAKSGEIDRVVGFELGADDYVVKPFSVRELLLRIKAVLRRTVQDEDRSSNKVFGRLRLDMEAYRAWVDDQEVVLTALEFRLLNELLVRKGRVQTRDMLLSDVWGINADITTRTVDTHIKRLRQKLGKAGEYIETLRGVGYRFKPTDEDNR